jgi:hypothetical protein
MESGKKRRSLLKKEELAKRFADLLLMCPRMEVSSY